MTGPTWLQDKQRRDVMNKMGYRWFSRPITGMHWDRVEFTNGWARRLWHENATLTCPTIYQCPRCNRTFGTGIAVHLKYCDDTPNSMRR